MTKTLLKSDAELPIPPEVAVCPYCDTQLTATFTGWEEEEDGSWTCSEVDLSCETEPDLDNDGFEDWLRGHTEMPYVYMLPVKLTVTKWVNAHYRFNLD